MQVSYTCYARKINKFMQNPYMVSNCPLFLGVILTEGETWKHNRRFCLSCLRDMGMGKSSMESKIVEEINVLLEVFKKQNQQAFNCTWDLFYITIYIITHFKTFLKYHENIFMYNKQICILIEYIKCVHYTLLFNIYTIWRA